MSDTITRRDAFYVLDICRFASEQEKRYAYSLMEQVASADVKDTNVLSNDTISRQAAIDAINALHEHPNAWLDYAVDTVMELPSAQPEIVRCKDCRYVWNEDGWDNLWCNRLTGSFSVEKDGGCSWGKI